MARRPRAARRTRSVSRSWTGNKNPGTRVARTGSIFGGAMIRRSQPRILPSEITPEAVFLDRRAVLTAGLALGASSLLAAAEPQPAGAKLKATRNPKYSVTEELNSYEDITGYNNFYEFGTDKEDPKAN